MTQGAAPLTPEECSRALELARASLDHYVRTGMLLKPRQPFTGGLALPCGAFVSLHTQGGELRGCIGHMEGEGPLGELILELAVAAGTRDSRFEPVTESELPDLVYEISVLTPMQPIDPADVTPGVHGLYIRRGRHGGVLLPQVATEWGWDRETFLDQTCRKAGLPPGAWREPGTEVLAFTAQVVSEDPSRRA
ncbi:MAG: AmmeMemoRadiSam system protein A [Planctomycetes bacterium]|nr:AmmeMemoRadiSam system protein A [Planctomycetota bacterium]MCW8136828.1 AmmeMemoRadiSam system protein A [Planctomycetota bacterium]